MGPGLKDVQEIWRLVTAMFRQHPWGSVTLAALSIAASIYLTNLYWRDRVELHQQSVRFAEDQRDDARTELEKYLAREKRRTELEKERSVSGFLSATIDQPLVPSLKIKNTGDRDVIVRPISFWIAVDGRLYAYKNIKFLHIPRGESGHLIPNTEDRRKIDIEGLARRKTVFVQMYLTAQVGVANAPPSRLYVTQNVCNVTRSETLCDQIQRFEFALGESD